ncbi:MAG: PAS domain S-box protein [Planctomycetes bacterium]|nr:PAS domain S-box protein [Planctomycetota bacterium]
MIKMRNMTIRSKLTVIMMVVSAAAVALSCAIFMVSSFILLKMDHLDKDHVLAELTCRNSQAAIMFDVPEDAEKILSSLAADPSIEFAAIYTPDGEVFAVYNKNRDDVSIEAPQLGEEGHEYSGGYLKLFHHIRFDDKVIGTLYLLDNQEEVYASFRWDMVTLGIVMLITLASAYLIAFKLQTVISGPILSLAETAGAISKTEDYSIRAIKHGGDEVGVLIDSFNSMLNEIQEREDALAESEAKFRSIVETSSDWIWEIDADGIYIYSSPKIKDLLGYEPQEVLGKRPFELMTPDESERMIAHFTELSKRIEPFDSLENINLHKDGRQVILETSAVPIFDENGEFCGFRGIDRDITERKRVEEQIAVLARFPAENQSPVLRICRNGKLLYANDASKLLLDEWNCAVGELVPDYLQSNVHDALLGRLEHKIELEVAGRVYSFLIAPIPEADYVNLYGRDITDRKRSEEALKISEANYRSIFDSVNDSILIHEIDTGKIINTNSQAAMMFGYSQEEFQDITIEDLSVIEENYTLDEAMKWIRKAGAGGPQLFEWHSRNKYDRAFWTEISLRSVILEGRKCLLALVRDIDERKRGKDALASSEARFRALAENANSSVISLNNRGQIVFWNPAAEKMFGYSSAEALSQLFSLILSQQHYEDYSNDLEQIRLTGQSGYTKKIVEFVGLKKDGREFPMEMSLSKWNTPEGLFFTAMLTDITERKEAADALRLDEARLQVLVELNQMTDVTEKELVDFALEQTIQLTSSKIGYIAFLNEDESVFNMFSWSKEVMGECMLMEGPVSGMGLVGEAVRQRRPIISNDYQGNEPLKKGYPEGHVRIERHMNIPVFDGSKIIAVAGVGNKEDVYNDSDVRQLTLLMNGMWRIIQRNKTEEERKVLLKTLASKNEELESIVYTASHDLRSPLVNIDGFSSELALSCQEVTETLMHTHLPDSIEHSLLTILNEDIPASLKYIRTSATKMDMLMRGLLKLSRLGREATEIETLNMNELIGNICLGMQHQIKKQHVELVIGPLPECLGDKSQISQVFTNLLDNAIKYLDPAKKGKIQVSGESQAGESIYSVSDNGVGIDQECHHKIFEIFHRLDPEGTVRGEGIGLTIVKRIIDRHNGRMWVESSVGEGTTFHVALRNE